MNHLESLRNTIQRYDSYYDSTNNKASFLLALATAMLGGSAVLIERGNLTQQPTWFIFVVILGLLALTVGIILTLSSITPYTKGGVTSMMFYGSVSKLDLTEFKTKVLTQTDSEELEDHSTQVHMLAIGLSNKFQCLKVACYFLGTAFTALFIIILFLIFNK